jgi:hypothetical protein
MELVQSMIFYQSTPLYNNRKRTNIWNYVVYLSLDFMAIRRILAPKYIKKGIFIVHSGGNNLGREG